MRVRDVADLVAWLPAGCALWLSVGGPASKAQDVRQLESVAYLLQVLAYQNAGGKGRKPEPPKDPEWAHEREARENAQNAKAAAYLRRQDRLASSVGQ